MFPQKAKGINPCVKAFGYGPVNVTCKSCAKLRRKQLAKNYFKCVLRGDSGGRGTDHKMNWPACGKYVRNPEVEL